MSSPLAAVNPDSKSTALLCQPCFCVLHGGTYVQLQHRTRYNTLRFSFFVDVASCKPSPQSLFSLAAGHKEHLLATVQSCSYPSAEGFARLTLALSGNSYSTKIPCGSWVSVTFSILDLNEICSQCGGNPIPVASASAVTQKFALHVTIGAASFLVSSDFPRDHFREPLLMGSRAPEDPTQPSLFRDLIAEVSSPLCIQCVMIASTSVKSCAVEKGFSASLPLRCHPLDLEGSCWRLPQHFSPHNRQTLFTGPFRLCPFLG